MQYVDDHGYGLHQLVYVSRMTEPLTAGEVDEIVRQSSISNAAKNVTGALLLYADTFIQVLEGDRATVEPLFRKIEADKRHTDIELKAVEPVGKRRFGRWGMRLGKTPDTGAVDLTALPGHQLVTLLALSTGLARAKAA